MKRRTNICDAFRGRGARRARGTCCSPLHRLLFPLRPPEPHRSAAFFLLKFVSLRYRRVATVGLSHPPPPFSGNEVAGAQRQCVLSSFQDSSGLTTGHTQTDGQTLPPPHRLASGLTATASLLAPNPQSGRGEGGGGVGGGGFTTEMK